MTKSTFCEDIDIEEFRRQIESEIQKENEKDKKNVNIDDLDENYKKVNYKEREEEISKIRRINNKVQQIANGRNER